MKGASALIHLVSGKLILNLDINMFQEPNRASGRFYRQLAVRADATPDDLEHVVKHHKFFFEDTLVVIQVAFESRFRLRITQHSRLIYLGF